MSYLQELAGFTFKAVMFSCSVKWLKRCTVTPVEADFASHRRAESCPASGGSTGVKEKSGLQRAARLLKPSPKLNTFSHRLGNRKSREPPLSMNRQVVARASRP